MEKVLIEVSAKHMHLSRHDAEVLFGKDHKFTPRRKLKCDGVFVTSDSVEIHHAGKIVRNVRIIMPFREKTSVELSATDLFKLTKQHIFDNGHQKRFTIEVIGPQGEVTLDNIEIVALRHLHANPEDAKKLNLHDGQIVKVQTEGPRSITFNNIKVRVHENFVLTCHLDTDEGQAAGISLEGEGILIRE